MSDYFVSPAVAGIIYLLSPLVLVGAPAPTTATAAPQAKSSLETRRQRVDLLRDELKQTDARIESRLDVIVDTLELVTDSKDSKTKVARMKENTGKALMKTIGLYDQKRAALKEELRRPTLNITPEEKQKLIAALSAKIEKRTQQIIALSKSMPSHEDHERYRTTGGGWWGTEYQRNEEFDQNRRMTTHVNAQRDAIVNQLDGSIARLDRQRRSQDTQLAGVTDPAVRKALSSELATTDALIAERRKQKLETLAPSGAPSHIVPLKEAMDMDKSLQAAVADLRRDFNGLFARYSTYLGELSALHTAEAALAAATKQ